MAIAHIGPICCRYRTGIVMKPTRVFVLIAAMGMITGLAGLGILQSPDGMAQTALIAITAIISILLVFGVEIRRIEYGKLKVVFDGDNEE